MKVLNSFSRFTALCSKICAPLFLILFFLTSFAATGQSVEVTPEMRELQKQWLATHDSVKIGVALSGGSATGYAHLGFLQALEDAGVRIDCISGTSMGAILGALYAAGYSPREIVQIIKKEKLTSLNSIFRPNLQAKGGFSDMRHIRRAMRKYIPADHFDSLRIPFYCCVTDINHLRPVYVSHGGNLCRFVTASASIPTLFSPVQIDSVYYVDGFVTNNLPVEPLVDAGCTVRIGVFIQQDTVMEQIRRPRQVKRRAFNLFSNLCTYDHLHLCTHTVPINVHGMHKRDFNKISQFFIYGYIAGVNFLKEQFLNQTALPEGTADSSDD